MGPSNGIIGDFTGTELPQKDLSEDLLVEEKKMAKFTRTAEFKRIEEWCQERITFYQTCLPNGAEIGLDVVPSTEDWRVANRVIGEFKALMNLYQTANTAVEENKENE